MYLSPRLTTALVFLGGLVSGLFLVAAYHYSYIFFGPTGCVINGETLGCEQVHYPYGTMPRPSSPQTNNESPTTTPSTPAAVDPSLQNILARFQKPPDTRREELAIAWEKHASSDATAFFTDLLSQPINGGSTAEDIKTFITNRSHYLPDSAKPQVWRLGVVKGGSYDGQVLYAWKRSDVGPEGPGFWSPYQDWLMWFLVAPNKEIRVINLTDYLYTPFADLDGTYIAEHDPRFVEERAFILAPNLTFSTGTTRPNTVTLENGKTLYQTGGSTYPVPGCSSTACDGYTAIAKTQSGETVFNANNQGLLIVNEAGMVFEYNSYIALREVDNGSGGTTTTPEIGAETIQWNAGLSTQQTFRPAFPGGCGYANRVDLADASSTASNLLIQGGKTKSGDPIYVPKDPANNPMVQQLYDLAYFVDASGNKRSFEEYLRQYPVLVFYWKDALGRWVQYTNTAYTPAAECGKPVIYLYPETTTDIRVRLPSFVNVTVSDPAYPRAGWKTTAHPDGTLVMADGSTFGSLYWEGTGVGYATPKDGFVVKDGQVDQFLSNILPKYGLNEREMREFKEF